ncbi:MAG: phosphatidate cytidylyltransferase [Clostridia bacterium]|nr:phosphatidate cytidylyltransferase [Clostridia bacterium]
MAVRIISGVIGAILLLTILLALPEIATIIAVAIIASIALFEFCNANKLPVPVIVIAYFIGLGVMFCKELLASIIIGLILFLITNVLIKKVTFKDCAYGLFGSIYVFGMMKYIFMVRLLNGGKYLIFAIFIGAFFTDIGAYFAGRAFGKHKLAPVISPKKTIEGSVGGVVLAVLGLVAFTYAGSRIFVYTPNYLNASLIAVILSVISQFGDLGASSIKREAGIKDYGKLMPGHGGALDRFDSVLFVAPVFYYLNMILPIFVIK